MASPINDELSRSLRDVMDSTQFPQDFPSDPIIEERVVEVFVPVYEKEIVEVPQVWIFMMNVSTFGRYNMLTRWLRFLKFRFKRK